VTRRQSWLNILAIRFRGIDPDAFLSWLYPRMRWCYSFVFLSACLVLVLSAFLLLLAEAGEFRRGLPSLREFVSVRNVFWLAATLGATKIIHEFAHALTCKRYGGECHEMGIMLLVFTPCLYCDVTDSWMLGNRWQRIAVAVAGMWAEMILASLAVFGWWFTQPGLLHTICINTVLVCGAATVLFNGNPLLRYDGYFILSDLLAMPNLWHESRNFIRRRARNWILAIEEDPRWTAGQPSGVLAIYGLASMFYRVVVAISILLFLYHWLQPQGLGPFVHVVAGSMVAGAIFNWTFLLRQHDGRSPSWRDRKVARISATLALVIAVLVTIFFLPIPCRVAAPALVQVREAQRIYVSTPGTLTSVSGEGELMRAGQTIARLEDPDLHRTIAELDGDYQKTKTRVRHLSARAAIDADAAAELVVTEKMCADVGEQLARHRREEEALTLKAPVDGTLIPPPSISAQSDDMRALTRWSGTPLERRNTGCYLQRGTLLCLVGDPSRHEAVVFVDGTDIQYVRPGQRVRMRFDTGPAIVLDGEVAEVAQRDLQIVPAEVAAEKELASRTDSSGQHRPLRSTYQVRVNLDAPLHDALVIGVLGRAKIAVDRQSLSQRLYRVLRRALTIEM
jgi:putative peptide zinc metalloprotease protein